ncbi:MAG: Eco57I restriction-modification methylase domain-containing protein, partial [Bacteroidales bacterium]
MEDLAKTKFVKTIVLLYKQVKNEDINLNDGELTDVLFYTLFDCFLKENGIDWRELLNINDDNLQARYPDFVMAIKEICKNYRFDYDDEIKNSKIITPRYLSFIQERIFSIQKNNDGLTKRQLTGTFYTPELIVNYMVNESLQLYLQNVIRNFNGYNIFQSEKLNITPFDKETLDLSNLYNIRILDPAVGTGNFIVNLLEKLTTLLFFQSQHDIERFNIKKYLIENCLFGIDIQKISIEISKFRLLCSLLKETQNKKETLLKNISFNLFVYDTLKIKKPTIGLFDFNNLDDKGANIEKLYSILNNEGGFDIVLGNPPYINLQRSFNGGTTLYNYYKKDDFKTITGTGDIYVLFYEKGLHLLKKNGILCFLTSNKWIRSDYGIPLQKLLSQYNIYKFINLSNQMFKNAGESFNILLLINQNKHNITEAINLKNIDKEIKDYPQLINLISTKSLKIKDFAKNGWIIGNDNVIKLKNKIEKYGKRLWAWEIKFYIGLSPPLLKNFLVTTKTKDDLLQNCKNEGERERTASIIKPVLRGTDI